MNHEEHGGHGEKNHAANTRVMYEKDASGLRICREDLLERVIGAAITVHKHLGPGLLESVYEMALLMELAELRIPAQRQVEIPVFYRGHPLGTGFRADIVVANCLLLEIKSVDAFHPIHEAQVINYLKLLQFKRGLLINFNKKLLKEGIKRVSV